MVWNRILWKPYSTQLFWTNGGPSRLPPSFLPPPTANRRSTCKRWCTMQINTNQYKSFAPALISLQQCTHYFRTINEISALQVGGFFEKSGKLPFLEPPAGLDIRKLEHIPCYKNSYEEGPCENLTDQLLKRITPSFPFNNCSIITMD